MPTPSSCVVDLKCEAGHGVMVRPRDVVKRCAFAWDGMAAEIVKPRRERMEFRFRGPRHFLPCASRACEARATPSSRACRDRRCET